MRSAHLLVIDNSPDHAQVINSYLRNSGLAVTVVSAADPDELEIVLQEKTPFLIVLGRQLPPSMKISQVLQAADHHSTPVAMQIKSEDSANIEAALATHPILIINAEEDEQLMQVVKQHMSGGKTVREYDDCLLYTSDAADD